MLGLKESPWIIHYDASSCNGCDIETLACLTPMFDVERLGVVNTGNPKHADIFLVTGAVNEQCKSVIGNIYNQMPEPKAVVAVGICASTGGIFRECYNIAGGVDCVIPVDVYVPGCAARPEAIIDGVVQALGVLTDKHKKMTEMVNNLDQTVCVRAEKRDASEILALQKLACQTEVEVYGDENIPPLQETLHELEAEFDEKVFVKAVINGKIIGSARGYAKDEVANLSWVMVHPFFRGRGIGQKLVIELEGAFPQVKRFDAYTGHKSKWTIQHLEKMGYQTVKTESFTPAITWVHLQKERA